MGTETASICVTFHAAARDFAGRRTASLHAPLPNTVAELRLRLADEYPKLAMYLDRMQFAVNDEFTVESAGLHPGDRVDVMPPVAGGSVRVFVGIREEALSLDEAIANVSHSGAGAVATFLGIVRDHADGKSVGRLDYEAQISLATKEMRRVLERICDEVGDVRMSAFHRIGELNIGDVAVVVAASAAHRKEAFAACRLAIDRIKETVPIWKREWDTEGQPCWVGLDAQ